MACVGKYHAGIVKVGEPYVYLVAIAVNVSLAFEAPAKVLQMLKGSEYEPRYRRARETYRKQRVRIGWSYNVIAGRGDDDIPSELDSRAVCEAACMARVESRAGIEWNIIAWDIEMDWLTTTAEGEGNGLEVTRKGRQSLLPLSRRLGSSEWVFVGLAQRRTEGVQRLSREAQRLRVRRGEGERAVVLA